MAKSKTTRRRAAAAADLPARVRTLAFDLSWTWNHDVQRVFAALDPALWAATNRDPLRVIAQTPAERWEALRDDTGFVALLERCEKQSEDAARQRGWFQRTARGRDTRLCVAYFCSEFAIHESLPQYSGGLGVLAGDHLKAASDLGIPLVGVGLLYRNGYFQQRFAPDGSQRAVFPRYDFEQMPLTDTGKSVDVPTGRRPVVCKIWEVAVGRTRLLLLDADHRGNRPTDRTLTHALYAGNPEHRLRQQVLLGVGGFMALGALGLKATVFHMNEGHAAFCGLARLADERRRGRSIKKAIENVRKASVFTTHTPVPAGHDRYEPKLIVKHLRPMMEAIGMDREALLALGREDPGQKREWFCMTVLALRLSAHCNGVAELHGDTSRRMWRHIYPGLESPDEVPIGFVTNGIHPQTWIAPEALPLYQRHLKPRWDRVTPSDDPWKAANRIPPTELWELRSVLRRRLVQFVRERLADQIQRQAGPIDDLVAAQATFDENALTIGFARRFATYKRAPLIFRDAKRLAMILNSPHRPVQLVFAGKAHPSDKQGQDFARRIYRHAHSAGFRGRVVVVENYDMCVGRMLTSGCDVWLNNPLRPNEASGTSGMKPPLHGGLNCSILDGWWPEAFNGRNGWAIGDGRTCKTAAAQDRYDAECIYELLETQIVPTFYERGRDGVPRRWVKMMAESMRSVCAKFSAHRMLGEYVRGYYLPAHRVK